MSPCFPFFGLAETTTDQVAEREYNGRVTEVRLNSTCAAVLCGSKVILQRIEVDGHGAVDGPAGRRGRSSSISSSIGSGAPTGGGVTPGPGPRRTFPEREDREHGEATAVGLTESFLIYATKAGTVQFFCLSEWAPLAGVELKHPSPVLRLWPNYLGTRVVFVDAASAGWLYSPASDKLTQVGITLGQVRAVSAVHVRGVNISRVFEYKPPFERASSLLTRRSFALLTI